MSTSPMRRQTAGSDTSQRNSPPENCSLWSRWRKMRFCRTMSEQKRPPAPKRRHWSVRIFGIWQKQILLLALLSLKDTDRELINALFFDGASTRECAQRMGVSQRAVIKRRDRILRDLKKFFENSSK